MLKTNEVKSYCMKCDRLESECRANPCKIIVFVPEFQQGDWVLYNGKPREVYKFYPFGGEDFPEIERDSRYDTVELLGLKAPVRTANVQRMVIV